MSPRNRTLKYALAASCLFFTDAHASIKTCSLFFIARSKQPLAAHVVSTAGPRLYFQRNAAQCPGGADCNAKAYLLPNDKVIIDDDGGQWLCAIYRGTKVDTTGWLPRASLVIDTTPSLPTKQDWIGRWEYGHNTLLFDDRPGKVLFFRGFAITPPWFTSWEESEVTPVGNKIAHKDSTCRITMRWVSGMILASNTRECVGSGNSYYGLYVRTALATAPEEVK